MVSQSILDHNAYFCVLPGITKQRFCSPFTLIMPTCASPSPGMINRRFRSSLSFIIPTFVFPKEFTKQQFCCSLSLIIPTSCVQEVTKQWFPTTLCRVLCAAVPCSVLIMRRIMRAHLLMAVANRKYYARDYARPSRAGRILCAGKRQH